MKRGDIVILDHPYCDGSGSKVRPALVVQNDRDNFRLTDTIVALITRNITRVGEPTQLLVDLSTAEGRQSGLNPTPAVVCTDLFTISQVKVRRVIGSLPVSLMTRVDDCLKAALELP
jgi:mRNA interferase MazF